MIVEFVNEQGFSLAVCETPAIIKRYRNTESVFEVPVCTENFYLKKWDFENEIWTEGATPEQIQKKQSLILMQKETLLYEKRIADGIRKYAEISARFRLAKQSGHLDSELHIYLENTLRPVRNEVLAGQWMTAQELMQEIISQHVSIPAFDEIYQMITNYINTEGGYNAH